MKLVFPTKAYKFHAEEVPDCIIRNCSIESNTYHLSGSSDHFSEDP